MFILLYKRELFFNIEIKSSDKKDTTEVVPFFMAETERFSSSTLRYANFGLANRATPKACALGASPFASSAQISLMRFFTNVKKLNHSIVLPLPKKANLLFEDPFLCSSSNILNHE